MSEEFTVVGPQSALAAFEEAATAAGFSVSRSQQHNFSVGPQNLSECLHLIFSKEGAVVFSSLATVITVFLQARAARRITITQMQPGKIGSLDARGYSEKELAEILTTCNELIVYEPKQTKPKA